MLCYSFSHADFQICIHFAHLSHSPFLYLPPFDFCDLHILCCVVFVVTCRFWILYLFIYLAFRSHSPDLFFIYDCLFLLQTHFMLMLMFFLYVPSVNFQICIHLFIFLHPTHETFLFLPFSQPWLRQQMCSVDRAGQRRQFGPHQGFSNAIYMFIFLYIIHYDYENCR